MRNQQSADLEKIEQYNIYQCLELYRDLKAQEPPVSRLAQYKTCLHKVEKRIIKLVTV